MFDETKYTILAAIAGIAILSAIAIPGMTAASVAAQAAQGNETSTTPTLPSGNNTAIAPGANGTSQTSVTLMPTSGTAGSNITIDGMGFSPAQTYTFTFDGGYLLTGNMVQNTTGEFSTTAIVPANATSGDHQVKVTGSTTESATATFTVVQGSGNQTATAGNGTLTTPQGNESSISPMPSGNKTASNTNATSPS
jgi:hypothetical protein